MTRFNLQNSCVKLTELFDLYFALLSLSPSLPPSLPPCLPPSFFSLSLSLPPS